MKKSALLAVSALSLGVVGLATFTPVVNAATDVSQTSTISVTVKGEFGIGTEDGSSAYEENVTLDQIGANEMTSKETFIKLTNNTGNSASLTVKDQDADTNLKMQDGSKTIPTGAGVAAGTAAWGISTNGGTNYQAMVANSEAGINLYSGADSATEVKVTYGVSTTATTAAGTYSDTVIYTFSQ